MKIHSLSTHNYAEGWVTSGGLLRLKYSGNYLVVYNWMTSHEQYRGISCDISL